MRKFWEKEAEGIMREGRYEEISVREFWVRSGERKFSEKETKWEFWVRKFWEKYSEREIWVREDVRDSWEKLGEREFWEKVDERESWEMNEREFWEKVDEREFWEVDEREFWEKVDEREFWEVDEREFWVVGERNSEGGRMHVCSVTSVVPDSSRPSIRLMCPWDSPGKNTRVGCHALLQGIFPTQG